ncbi:MAG TPA: sulfate ABC transporter substrate-binding protein [Pirellulaceae bacterium]
MHRPIGCLALLLFTALGCNSSSDVIRPTSSSANERRGDATTSLTLLNVSYDPTREFYQEFNAAFRAYWQSKTGQEVTIDQSHGGSGKQARAVIDGLEADVVTLALGYDIDAIAQTAGLLPTDWQGLLPHRSSPYASTIVFLVRKGNPRQIRDWDDLVEGDLKIITPNPKTSGGARWNYLAAWGFALKRELGDWSALRDPARAADVQRAESKAQEFVREIYRRVPVLDSGARGSTATFVQREMGDVLLAWENEAFLAVRELGPEKVEVVVPSVSILAEPPVAVVRKVAEKHGTLETAQGYLEFLYSPQGQQIAAKHHYRPSVAELISDQERAQFSQLELFTVEQVFGDWKSAQSKHFRDGGMFDQIYALQTDSSPK